MVDSNPCSDPCLTAYSFRPFAVPFINYAPDARAAAAAVGVTAPEFLHYPIVDFSAPPIPVLHSVASTIAVRIARPRTVERKGTSSTNAVYLHCWGGRGRAGLISAAVLGLLDPTLTAEAALNTLQQGLDERTRTVGLEPASVRTTPETDEQVGRLREFFAARDAGNLSSPVGRPPPLHVEHAPAGLE